MSGNPPVDVQEIGQSIWIDNIRRLLITDGTFRKWIDEFGVVGVTSNPSIFQKAIGGSNDYDDDIKLHLEDETLTIYETLATKDIRDTADLFRPIYDRTNGRDGYVSLEVSPLLARDTQGTIDEAKRLFEMVGKPNVMIKIPATPECIPAIEEAIASGVNVNVTLIFSVKNYIDVAMAYIRGLERRHEAGEDISRIASVASFFLSRIDVMVDQILQNNIRAAQGRDVSRISLNERLLGKAAIANAKIAYKNFQEMFYGERFAKLREAGAQVQRPLWASTSTKNPAYPDTMYVDSLIGPDTVNTLPPETLVAFKDHGTVAQTLTDAIEDAINVLDMLAEVGIDIEHITHRLQDDGVDAFSASFESLFEQIDSKRTVLSTGVIANQKLALGMYDDAVQKCIKMLNSKHIIERIWAKDGSVWKDNGPTIAKIEQRLGWLDVEQTIDISRLKKLQSDIQGNDIDHVVLLGMGGSSLAPEVLYQTLGRQEGFPKFLMLDSTVPERILEIENAIDLSRTLFIVASKSGSTIETRCFHQYFYEKTGQKGNQFIAITDPGSEMAATAEKQGFRDIFLNPADIGGRYSALSYFGMVPAALFGADLDRLWTSALEMLRACGENITAENNAGVSLGAVLGTLALQGRDKVGIFASPSLSSFGSWVEQLIAESTGKEGKGILPVVGATIGKPHDYATDRVFVYLKVEGDPANPELDERVKALREAGHPRITLLLKDVYAVGGEFVRWEMATAVAGHLLEINPFDEPNVTESKQNTSRLLEHYVAHGSLPEPTPVLSQDGVRLYANPITLDPLKKIGQPHGFKTDDLIQLLGAQMLGTHAGDYFAILAYLPPSAEVDAKLLEIRRRLRHITRRAVTVGYGPRYLHSTGQLHKGGANNGVFIQLTHTTAQDVDIPGEPFSFSILNQAQAAGDFEALDAHMRRALRLDLGSDIMHGLDVLLQAVDFVGSRAG
jgi:transaldolase/glucose-6-phosphate isomerase